MYYLSFTDVEIEKATSCKATCICLPSRSRCMWSSCCLHRGWATANNEKGSRRNWAGLALLSCWIPPPQRISYTTSPHPRSTPLNRVTLEPKIARTDRAACRIACGLVADCISQPIFLLFEVQVGFLVKEDFWKIDWQWKNKEKCHYSGECLIGLIAWNNGVKSKKSV